MCPAFEYGLNGDAFATRGTNFHMSALKSDGGSKFMHFESAVDILSCFDLGLDKTNSRRSIIEFASHLTCPKYVVHRGKSIVFHIVQRSKK
jgi:hypothetical protein